VVLHDLGLAARFCGRLFLLNDGRLIAAGHPEAVLTDSLLAEAHHVSVYRSSHRETSVLVPWSRLPIPNGPEDTST
jgi:iron complex transport system ATP-binding protein